MTEYVAGLLFDESADRVALVRKNRPAWQKGKWNAIGGHIEEDDISPLEAMRREFWEEAGVWIPEWRNFVDLRSGLNTIHFFTGRYNMITDVKTITDEEVLVWDVNATYDFPYYLIPNLSWLIPLAKYEYDNYNLIQVVENE